MNIPTIIIALVIAAGVVAVVRNEVKKRKKGICCGCSGCSGGCNTCNIKQKSQNTQKK